ncbi:MAG: YbjQ family protein [Campylobacteraceae bacterium]|jgi:uncharacterized protein YbjQ (UPF0145 family)|nr:YbjQ family protein [Campylobacteraceae bacterium]
MEIIIYAIIFCATLFFTYFIGSFIEARHYDSIKRREMETRNILIFNEKNVPENLVSGQFYFVSGSVVISGSHFKQFIASLKSIFGGRIRSLETTMDLGRREAILRMKEEAKNFGTNTIFNVRFETSMIGQREGKKGVFCAEFLVYGTAWRRK